MLLPFCKVPSSKAFFTLLHNYLFKEKEISVNKFDHIIYTSSTRMDNAEDLEAKRYDP